MANQTVLIENMKLLPPFNIYFTSLDRIESWEDTAHCFGILYVIVGCLAINLNLTFLYSLLVKCRRKSFSSTFYIMIIDFTVIDTIKGISSILFAIKFLKSNLNLNDSLLFIRIDQFSVFLLRFANLATILNLLTITLNEYVFICYPLRYSTLITRRRIVVVIICIWVISLMATLAKILVGLQNRRIWIDDVCTLEAMSLSSCVYRFQTSGSAQFVYHLVLMVFCLTCLIVTVYSYSILFRVVSNQIRAEIELHAELEHLNEQAVEGKQQQRRIDNKQLLRRYKHVVVIGIVICVYTVYMIAYATIQVLLLVDISETSDGSHHFRSLYLKYICYFFISLHSLLQPLCYLRIREFRMVVKRTLCSKSDNKQAIGNDICSASINPKNFLNERDSIGL
ncbi:7 transmembrane receptor [Dictyocaulus viviparus]|uniref:7 transmembrane receptor n=1 Tax=Dictyocaulus viviparus TaxID=29172 RepID=A0A0D8XFH0_DICVI|nr:7 transmembrane receptor [Dictyocaulus viviparus]